ncbi:hypothetical protein FWH30_01895 [Microgenomates group bacterium]|nr:hypothetical protein [Microgenomates group bacterium]
MVVPKVIASSDEGLQLNDGVRLGFVGAGLGIAELDEIIEVLQEQMEKSGDGELVIVSSQEDDIQDDLLQTRNIGMVAEKMTAFASKFKIGYAGHIDFGDPRNINLGVRGHLVRPPRLHVADSVCFTLAGGEHNFSLRHFVLSADWVFALGRKKATKILTAEVAALEKLSGKKLKITYDMKGDWDPKIAAVNKEIVEAIFGVSAR